jgi:uncharacterized SAM-binding protein YcdF (DUF218 family)
MFYMASRLAGFLFSASNLLTIFAFAGTTALFANYARLGRNWLAGVATAYFLCGYGPLGAILIRPLEDWFPLPSGEMSPPTGIIVLGGALQAEKTNSRGIAILSEGGGRLTQTAILAHRYPDAEVVFTGTTGELMDSQADEAHDAEKFLTELGVASGRFQLETHSRNTDENAQFTRDLVKPKADERWLLVTSAAHLPRAVGAFRHAGFQVIPYPTDYRTKGRLSDFWTFHTEPLEGLGDVDTALHEWLGLLAYRLTGRSDVLLPSANPR